MNDDERKKLLETFNEVCDLQGVVVSTVKNGHMMAFKRQWLQDLLDRYPDQPKIVLFIERPTSGN